MMQNDPKTQEPAEKKDDAQPEDDKKRPEIKHPDPTRYNDWEKDGRCIDF